MRKTGRLSVSILLASLLAACGESSATQQSPDPATEGAALQLPLRRGYYVESSTPCSEASNATTLLLRRDGIGGARDFCEFRKIEQTGPSRYRVVESCSSLQDDAPPEVGVAIYTLVGDDAFTSRGEDGQQLSARYCAQSTMSADFRANDIRDVTE